jgi:hypothetical protein
MRRMCVRRFLAYGRVIEEEKNAQWVRFLHVALPLYIPSLLMPAKLPFLSGQRIQPVESRDDARKDLFQKQCIAMHAPNPARESKTPMMCSIRLPTMMIQSM